MGGQLSQLWVEVAKELKGLQVEMQNLRGEKEFLRKQLQEHAEKIAGLEAEKRRDGEERRKVDKRLGTGDHTFGKLESMIANAEQIATSAHEVAKTALDAAEAARNANAGTKRRDWKTKLKEKILEALIPMAIGVVFWALYHVLLIGPEIAKLMKKVGP